MRYYFFIFLFSTLLSAEQKSDLIFDVERSLMATCCWSGTVYDHGNKEMEVQIASMVNSGKNKKDILNYFTEKYGERVLAVPVAQGFNIFAWVAPIVVGFLGLFILYFYVKWPSSAENVKKSIKSGKIEFDKEIESELKKLD